VSGEPLMKDGELLSPSYADWVRSDPCKSCSRPPHSEQNHAPTRGAHGCINDLQSHAVCRWCHIRCGGEWVVDRGKRLPPIPLEQQLLWVAETLFDFLGRAPADVLAKVLADIDAWRASRVYVQAIPW
jgi:hypothetical protein